MEFHCERVFPMPVFVAGAATQQAAADVNAAMLDQAGEKRRPAAVHAKDEQAMRCGGNAAHSRAASHQFSHSLHNPGKYRS
ncbi:MAG: hypothetical protein ABIP87_02685 [Thermomonas sp.]